MGNPPYLGTRNQEAWHKSDMNFTFGNVQHGMLDYIGCWFYNGARYMLGTTRTRVAFVSTNSITQGIQVQMMWNPIFAMGMEIQFAHKTFTWSNNAKNKAAVFCVIIGYGPSNRNVKKLIYDEDVRMSVDSISPTLSEQSFSGVQTQSTSICGLRPILKGSLPADENNLTVYPSDKETLLNNHPEIAPIIKRFIGSQEFLRSEERYCLWVTEQYKDLAYSIPELRKRFELVSIMRRKSKKAATQRLASVPYRFAEDRYNPAPAILIPVVSSQRREYIPIGFVPQDTVVYYSSFAVYDADLFDFAVLTSKMHYVWMRATAGRLKSDFRYSATLCYNTFPFPKISNTQKEVLGNLAKEILLVRAEHTEMTLGDMYNPENFPDDLRAAHHALDLAVERCYREKPFESDEERLEFLFKQYVKLTTDKSTLWKI
jgi:type II restriction/modification system DNA methylase subunit YeeA